MTYLTRYDRSPDLAHIFQWITEEPMPFFAELRADRPVFRLQNGPILLTRYDDVRDVLTYNDIFTVKLYEDKMDPILGPYLLARDNQLVNTRDRSIMSVMLRRADLPNIQQTVRTLTQAAIQTGLRDQTIDIVEHISRTVPIQLCEQYFGFAGPSVDTMAAWSRAMNLDMFYNLDNVESIHQASLTAGEALKNYLTYTVRERRAAISRGYQSDDILSRLLSTQFADSIGFSDADIVKNMMFMLIGGVETISQSVVHIIDRLLAMPEQLANAKQAALADDDALLDAILWEALRFKPIVPFLVRLCEKDYLLAKGTERETVIEAGSVIFASVYSAMHDATALQAPTQFITNRPTHHYMHFGYGPHTCLCYELSLVEVTEILKTLLKTGNIARFSGAKGQIDYQNGPFAESFTIHLFKEENT